MFIYHLYFPYNDLLFMCLALFLLGIDIYVSLHHFFSIFISKMLIVSIIKIIQVMRNNHLCVSLWFYYAVFVVLHFTFQSTYYVVECCEMRLGSKYNIFQIISCIRKIY